MALDFGVLQPAQPVSAFFKGQEDVARNALTQEKLAQDREVNALRRQQLMGQIGEQEQARRRQARTEKTGVFRERLLRAPTPDAAREVVRMQYADPDVGPMLSQFSTLDQALAEVPDDPMKFETYRQQEAMGMGEWIKSQAAERSFQDVLQRAKGGQPPAAAPRPQGELVAAPIGMPTGTVREIAPGNVIGPETLLAQGANALAPAAAPTNAMAARPAAVGRTPEQIAFEIDTLSQSTDPRAKAMVTRLMEEYRNALGGGQNRPMAVSRGQVLVDPRTGQQIFAAPEPTTSLSDRFVPVGRLVFDRQTQQYISPTQAQLAQSQERAAGEGVAGRVKPPVGYRFTPTGDLEPIPGGPAARGAEGVAPPKPLTAAQEVARRDKLGKEFKSATAALQTTQDVLDSVSFVKAEPGLSRATGFTGTLLPSFAEGAAASAETRLKNLEGKITALGKAQAAATGAIGSIANQEWKILSDQIAAIDRIKGTGPLLKQLELVEAQAQGAMARIRDAYQRQFGEDFERFPQFSDLPPPKSSFKPRTPAGGAAPAAAAPTATQGTGGFRYLGKEGK